MGTSAVIPPRLVLDHFEVKDPAFRSVRVLLPTRLLLLQTAFLADLGSQLPPSYSGMASITETPAAVGSTRFSRNPLLASSSWHTRRFRLTNAIICRQ